MTASAETSTVSPGTAGTVIVRGSVTSVPTQRPPSRTPQVR
ncbi:MAG TPA: hypothetical protein VGH30_05915 [Jatrophihabitantaceae bacterium]